MSTIRAVACVMLCAAVTVVGACSSSDTGGAGGAGGSAAATPPAAPVTPRAMIISPAEGDTVSGDSLRVTMSVEGVRLQRVDSASAPQVPREGHLHIFVDKDVTPAGAPIPMGDPAIVHKGDASSQHVFVKLAPGKHRLIVVYAFSDHSPDMSVAMDTVNIIVR